MLDPDSICTIYDFNVNSLEEFDAMLVIFEKLYKQNNQARLACLRRILRSRGITAPFTTVEEARKLYSIQSAIFKRLGVENFTDAIVAAVIMEMKEEPGFLKVLKTLNTLGASRDLLHQIPIQAVLAQAYNLGDFQSMKYLKRVWGMTKEDLFENDGKASHESPMGELLLRADKASLDKLVTLWGLSLEEIISPRLVNYWAIIPDTFGYIRDKWGITKEYLIDNQYLGTILSDAFKEPPPRELLESLKDEWGVSAQDLRDSEALDEVFLPSSKPDITLLQELRTWGIDAKDLRQAENFDEIFAEADQDLLDHFEEVWDITKNLE